MKDLEIDGSYKVIIEDCCVTAEFTAVLTKMSVGDYYPIISFSNGVVITNHNAVQFTHVKTGESHGIPKRYMPGM